MKLAADSHQKIYFNDETLVLPRFHVHCGFWAKLLAKVFKIHGITLGNHVFIDPMFVERGENGLPLASFSLIVHEATHVLQYQKEGFFGFLLGYLREWFKFLREQGKRDVDTRWQAYYALRHETEARAAAEAYAIWRAESSQKSKVQSRDFDLGL
jgi:hypothetical protein